MTVDALLQKKREVSKKAVHLNCPFLVTYLQIGNFLLVLNDVFALFLHWSRRFFALNGKKK